MARFEEEISCHTDCMCVLMYDPTITDPRVFAAEIACNIITHYRRSCWAALCTRFQQECEFRELSRMLPKQQLGR